MCCVCTGGYKQEFQKRKKSTNNGFLDKQERKKTYEPYDFANAYIQKYAQTQILIE